MNELKGTAPLTYTITALYTMQKLHEFNRILTVHYSYTSLVSSDECVRRSLVQYVIELLMNRTIDIHNYSITMLKLDEFNRILTVHIIIQL